MQEIIDFIDVEVNDDLKADGGGCKFVSFEDGVVNIELTGACKGCMMNTMTLKMGIERVAKERFPEIKSVENINNQEKINGKNGDLETIRESNTGKNTRFKDTKTGKEMSRPKVIEEIKKGNYQNYIADKNGVPKSKPGKGKKLG